MDTCIPSFPKPAEQMAGSFPSILRQFWLPNGEQIADWQVSGPFRRPPWSESPFMWLKLTKAAVI
jgi:hypothetical protein